MQHKLKTRVFWLTTGLSAGLLFMGALRLSTVHPNILTPWAGFATPGYVIITVIFTILLVRAGLPHNKFGFGLHPVPRQIMLAIAAIIVLRVFAVALNPLLENVLGGGRNLERFSNVEGSAAALVLLLITNWTLAAFGEEFAYRIILMRGISFLLGDSRTDQIIALVLQALMFGLIHAYQGPAGIVGATFSGLVYGTVIIAGRWSIWPAALAHGTNNTFGIIALYLGQ